MKYDMSIKYNLMIVYDMMTGPEYTEMNLNAQQVVEFIKRNNLPDECIFLEDAKTGQLRGLKYEEKIGA